MSCKELQDENLVQIAVFCAIFKNSIPFMNAFEIDSLSLFDAVSRAQRSGGHYSSAEFIIE